MYTKLKFPHEVEKDKKKYNQYMEKKVKNSPLNFFVKPEPMIVKELPKKEDFNRVAA